MKRIAGVSLDLYTNGSTLDGMLCHITPGIECASCRTIMTSGYMPLENYIAANYTIQIDKEFHLENVYLLRRET
ncbi:MAG: hypothetical protein ABR530_02550 [Pyrinomonadaceae bacterium]